MDGHSPYYSHQLNPNSSRAAEQSDGGELEERAAERKYGPEGSVALALAPLSSSPGAGSGSFSDVQRRRGRPPGSGRKQQLALLGYCSKDNVVFASRTKDCMYSIGKWCCLHGYSPTSRNFWRFCHL